jgi:hypothetical protein
MFSQEVAIAMIQILEGRTADWVRFPLLWRNLAQ